MSEPGHVGWPPDWNDIVTRAAKGLPVYVPTDPKLIDQTPYIRFCRQARGVAAMSASCPSCGCYQAEGLLCWEDSAAYETMIRAVPALLDELQVAISKQAKISTGGKAGKGTAREKSPINFGALAVRDELLVEMALWGTTEIDEIRKHPKAAEIVSGMGKAVKNAYRCI